MQAQIINLFIITISWIAFLLFIISICFEIYTRNSLFFNKIGSVILKFFELIGRGIAIIFDGLVRLITSPLTASLYLLGSLLDIIYLFKDITRYQTIKKWITTGFYEYDIYDYEYVNYYRVNEKYQPRLKGIWNRYLTWLHNYQIISKEIPRYRMWFFVAYVCRLVWYFCYLGVYYVLHITKYGLCKLFKAQMAELLFFSVYFIFQTFKVEIGWPLHKLVWTIYTFCKQQLYYITPNFLIAHFSITFNLRLFEWYNGPNLDEELETPEHAEIRDHFFALHWVKAKPIQSEFVSNGLGTYVIYFNYLWIHFLLVFIYIPIWVLLLVAEFICKQLIMFINIGILLYQYLLRKEYWVLKLILVVKNISARTLVNYFLKLGTIILKSIVTLLTIINNNPLLPYILLLPIVISYYVIYYTVNILLHIPGVVVTCFMWLLRFIINHRLFWLILCALYWIDLRVLFEIGSSLSENFQSIIISLNIGDFFGNFMLLSNTRMEWASNMVKYFYPWASLNHKTFMASPNIGFRNYPEDMIGLLSWYVDPEQWCDAWNWDNPPYHMRYEEFGEHPPRPDFFWRKNLYDECYPFEACYHTYTNRRFILKMLHQYYGRNAKSINWPDTMPYGGVLASNDWWYLTEFLNTLESAQGFYRYLYAQNNLGWLRYGLYARNWRTRLFLFKEKPFAWFGLKLWGLRLQLFNKIVLTYTFYWLLYASYNPFYTFALVLAIIQKIVIILPYTFVQTVNTKFNQTFPFLGTVKLLIWDALKFCWLNLVLPILFICLNKLNLEIKPFNKFSIKLIIDYLTIIYFALTKIVNYYLVTSWLQLLVSYFCLDEYLKFILIQFKYYKWLILTTINFPMPALADFFNILLKPVLFYDRWVVFTQIIHQQFIVCLDYCLSLLLVIFDQFITRPEIISIKRHSVSTNLQYNGAINYHYMLLNQLNFLIRQYSYPSLGEPTYVHKIFNKFYFLSQNVTINRALLPDINLLYGPQENWPHKNQAYTKMKCRYLNFVYHILHNRQSNEYFVMYDPDNLSKLNFKLYNEVITSKTMKSVYFKSIYWTALYSIKLAFAPLVFITKTPSPFYKPQLPINLDLRDIITVEVSPYSKLLLNTGILSPLILPLIVIMKLQLVLDSWCLYLQIPRRHQKYRQRFSIRDWLSVGRRLWIQPVRRSQLFALYRWKPTNNDLVDNFLHFTSLKDFDHLMPHMNTCNDSLMLCNWEPGSVVSWMDDTVVHRVEAFRWWSLNSKLLYTFTISSIFYYFITIILLGICSNSFIYLICGDERQFKQRMLFSRQYNWDLYRTKSPAERAWLEFTRDEKENPIFTKDIKLTNNIKEKLREYELNLQQYLKYNSERNLRSIFLKIYNKSMCKVAPKAEDEIFINPIFQQYHLSKRHEIYARNEHLADRTYQQFLAYAYNKDYHINETWQEPDEEEYEYIHEDYRHYQDEINYYMFKQDEKLYKNLFNLDKYVFNMQLPVWAWHKDALNLRWYDLKDPYISSIVKGIDVGMSGRYAVENDDDQGYIPFGFLSWVFVIPLLLLLKPFLFLSGFWTHYIRNPFNISNHLQKYTSAIFNHFEICHNLLQWSTIQHPAYKRAGSMVGRAGRRSYTPRMEHVDFRNFYHVGAGLLQNVMGTKWSLFAPQMIIFASSEEIRLFYYFNLSLFALLFLYLARRNSNERKLSIRKLNSNLNTHFVGQLITAKAALKRAYLWFWR